jgi:hypothetical protein|eukprot:sb/3471342/
MSDTDSSDSTIEEIAGRILMSELGSSCGIIPGLVQIQSDNLVEFVEDVREGHTKEKWTENRPDMWPTIMSYSDEKFRRKYRVPRPLFHELVEKMPDHQDTTFRPATSKAMRMCICLRYLATGDTIETIADAHGVARSTADEARNEGIAMINRVLAFPSFSTSELHGIVADFESRGHFKVGSVVVC